MLISCCFFC